MKTLILISLVFLSGCSMLGVERRGWDEDALAWEPPTNELYKSFNRNNAECVQGSLAVPIRYNSKGWAIHSDRHHFYMACMEGKGYKAVKKGGAE